MKLNNELLAWHLPTADNVDIMTHGPTFSADTVSRQNKAK